jgi:hypothetical protein
MLLGKDFEEFISLLNQHEVEYLVIGAHAMGLHGVPRTTGDMDIWIAVSDANATKMIAVLRDFGFGALGLKKKDFLMQGGMVQLGYEPNRIDILTAIDGVDFQDAYSNRQVVQDGELTIPLLSLADLIKNKKAVGGGKDLSDISLILRKKKTPGNRR